MIDLLLAIAWDIALQYIIYGIIIVVCIVLLVFIRKRNKLPKHTDFRKKIESLLAQVNALNADEGSDSRYDFFKQVSRALYNTDKLNYTATVMAEKERDGDIGRVAAALESARNELAPYKYGRREKTDREGILAAEENVNAALDIMNKVIERDSAIKARRAKK